MLELYGPRQFESTGQAYAFREEISHELARVAGQGRFLRTHVNQAGNGADDNGLASLRLNAGRNDLGRRLNALKYLNCIIQSTSQHEQKTKAMVVPL